MGFLKLFIECEKLPYSALPTYQFGKTNKIFELYDKPPARKIENKMLNYQKIAETANKLSVCLFALSKLSNNSRNSGNMQKKVKNSKSTKKHKRTARETKKCYVFSKSQ